MKFNTKGKKVIVITGVSSGIGNAIVKELSKRKNVYIFGIGRNDIEHTSPNYTFVKTDISNISSIQESLKQFVDIKIDVFVNNAGSGIRSTIEELPIERIRDQFYVNFFGPTYLLQNLINKLRDNGMVINIGALGSIIETPTMGYYSISKLAFKKLLDILACETDIKVRNLYLGAVKSRFGNNIEDGVDINLSKYKNLYLEWQTRFRNFFTGKNRAEDVAIVVSKIIFNNSNIEFISFRDRIIAYSKRFLPTYLYKRVLNYYYRYES